VLQVSFENVAFNCSEVTKSHRIPCTNISGFEPRFSPIRWINYPPSKQLKEGINEYTIG